MTQITFLGTCGGRFATIYQTRSTGGIYIRDSINMVIDPGPGAILRIKEYEIEPTTIDLLLISHCHPDHYTDADVMVEAITRGGIQKRGAIIASESVINGIEGFDPKVSKYHLSRIEKVITAKAGENHLIEGVNITTTPTIHTDPSGVGFKIQTKSGVVTYTSDTSIDDDVPDSYMGSRILILALTTPIGIKLNHHLSPEDAVTILKKVQPEKALLTHFGLRAINSGPESIAEWIQQRSGIETIAAEDGMIIEIGEDIEIKKSLKPP
ncbi:MAG: MBL fold metallo-hydrolase [Methanomassiliicoccales archaeon]|nr:MAG: MBL fold metallo-hydrolase [Methanomassiliicoccales archaeon]